MYPRLAAISTSGTSQHLASCPPGGDVDVGALLAIAHHDEEAVPADGHERWHGIPGTGGTSVTVRRVAHLARTHGFIGTHRAGDSVNPTAPRRWLLVRKEAGLADSEDTGARWSLDHLFFDQDAVPTLIEVKRSSDTRIRREVVGQMLDYAANAVVYLPIEQIQAWFDERCGREGRNPSDVMAEALGPAVDPDVFWLAAKTNLQAGRIRLVFVADEIPSELQRIVEFLNGQMDPAEVIAIAIPQYVGRDGSGNDMKTLVPTVIGRTAEAERKKSVNRGPARQWDEEAFFAGLTVGDDVARALQAWAVETRLARVVFGKGKSVGSMHFHADAFGMFYPLFSVYHPFGESGTPRIELQFATWKKRPVLSDEGRRRLFLEHLNAASGIAIPENKSGAQVTFPLTTLKDAKALKGFTDAFADLVLELREASTGQTQSS